MGLRFRKSVKIAKGVKLNFSKSGISTTFGGKGASCTVGKGRRRVNVGIPGTGLSYSQQINSRKKQPDREFDISKDENGEIIVKYANGRRVTNPDVLKGVKATTAYKDAVNKLADANTSDSSYTNSSNNDSFHQNFKLAPMLISIFVLIVFISCLIRG